MLDMNNTLNKFVVGSVISIHGDVALEGKLVSSSEDIREVETQICDLLTNFSSRCLTIRQKYIAGKKLKKLSTGTHPSDRSVSNRKHRCLLPLRDIPVCCLFQVDVGK